MSSDIAMSMDFEDFIQLEFSGCYSSTTTTATCDDYSCNWNLSPVVDWEALSGAEDDFHDLIDSMIDDRGFNPNNASHDHEPCNSLSTDTTNNGEDDFNFKGLRLVHLLMATAEALTAVNQSRELARVLLLRLKELVSPNDGTNMERLAAYFTDALQALLEGTGGVHSSNKHSITNGPHRPGDGHQYHHTDLLAAFQLLQDMSPYVKFGHFTANQAILEAVAIDRRVHIVDYDIMEGIQWASLMQALVSRKDGPPAPHLRITALSRGGSGKRSISTAQETGRRLVAFAASVGQPFSFHQCRLDSDHENFKPSALKLVKGEALIINCMLHLHHFSNRAPDLIGSFLSGAKTLNPRLVTLVEEETGPIGGGGFVGRFMDSLHHYSAVYDSLEAGFPMQRRARALVERVFLGPQISGSLARIYRTRGEEGCSWGEWLGAVGYKAVNISFANHCQAKLLLGLFNDGYRVEELANNRLVLGWKSRRLLSASVWTSPSDSDL